MPILYYTVRANVSTGFVSANGTTSPIIFTVSTQCFAPIISIMQ